MINYFTLFFIKIFDFFHKRKILNFLKSKFNKFEILFDVGGHVGESIDLFLKNFQVNRIFSFEASPLNFKILNSKLPHLKKKFSASKIVIENLAVGNEKKKISINQFLESSSSTIKEVNQNSEYFKKKFMFLKKNVEGNFFYKVDVNMTSLYEYINDNNLSSIDFIKIDTEGYEYEVLLGLRDKIKNVKIIFFEHHYDNMIIKNYKFSDLHALLIKNNFKKIFKIKMPFRKSFEYIYENNLKND